MSGPFPQQEEVFQSDVDALTIYMHCVGLVRTQGITLFVVTGYRPLLQHNIQDIIHFTLGQRRAPHQGNNLGTAPPPSPPLTGTVKTTRGSSRSLGRVSRRFSSFRELHPREGSRRQHRSHHMKFATDIQGGVPRQLPSPRRNTVTNAGAS